jgi:hypothetical protein
MKDFPEYILVRLHLEWLRLVNTVLWVRVLMRSRW